MACNISISCQPESDGMCPMCRDYPSEPAKPTKPWSKEEAFKEANKRACCGSTYTGTHVPCFCIEDKFCCHCGGYKPKHGFWAK